MKGRKKHDFMHVRLIFVMFLPLEIGSKHGSAYVTGIFPFKVVFAAFLDFKGVN